MNQAYIKRILLGAFLLFMIMPVYAQETDTIRVWEMKEITFEAEQTYDNFYTDVTMWVELEGPDFSEMVYGFWDGGGTFKVRVVATEPGEWRWISVSLGSKL